MGSFNRTKNDGLAWEREAALVFNPEGYLPGNLA
jgi:hypothetical protein